MSALRLLGAMAVATGFAAGCAASPATEDTQSDEGAMVAYGAQRSPLDLGHYASDDGKTMLLLTKVGNVQHASLYLDGKIVETDVDVSMMSGETLRYRLGAATCDDNLHYAGKRGIQIEGTCADLTDLFSDNEAILGTRRSSTNSDATFTVKTMTPTGFTLDVASATGISMTWKSAIEARGATKCGALAVVFADRDHGAAYWVDAKPTDASCPDLPLYPRK